MKPRVVSTPATAPVPSRRMPVTSQFWMMSTPQRVGAARIAPGDRIVPRGAAAPLQRRADDGIADVGRDVERRAERLGLLRRQPFVVDAVAAGWRGRGA